MFSVSVFSALMLGLVFAFLVDISFNLRRVNKNIVELLKRYEEAHSLIKK